MSGGSAGWTQYVPWFLSIASLVWSAITYFLTVESQKSTRVASVRLDEFKRIRSTIDAVTADMTSARDTLRSLASSGAERAELQNQIGEQQKQLLEIYFRLESALNRADSSQFAGGQDWLSSIEGHWEAFLTCIDRAYGPHRSDLEVRAVPALAAAKLGDLTSAVEARLDREMSQFTTID
jgi:hypothetical protein